MTGPTRPGRSWRPTSTGRRRSSASRRCSLRSTTRLTCPTRTDPRTACSPAVASTSATGAGPTRWPSTSTTPTGSSATGWCATGHHSTHWYATRRRPRPAGPGSGSTSAWRSPAPFTTKCGCPPRPSGAGPLRPAGGRPAASAAVCPSTRAAAAAGPSRSTVASTPRPASPWSPEPVVHDTGPWFRRTWIRRTRPEIHQAGQQLATEAREMFAAGVAVYPSPSEAGLSALRLRRSLSGPLRGTAPPRPRRCLARVTGPRNMPTWSRAGWAACRGASAGVRRRRASPATRRGEPHSESSARDGAFSGHFGRGGAGGLDHLGQHRIVVGQTGEHDLVGARAPGPRPGATWRGRSAR